MSEPDALWEQALQEQEQEDEELRLARKVQEELDRLWGKHGDDVPWKDAE